MVLTRYQQEYITGKESIILNLAKEIKLAPCLVAKMILECHVLMSTFKGIGSEHHQKSYRSFREFSCELSLDVSDSILKNEVNKLMRHTCAIEDPCLRREVEECIQCDDIYSPLIDRVRK
jgi:hypothetical protein